MNVSKTILKNLMIISYKIIVLKKLMNLKYRTKMIYPMRIINSIEIYFQNQQSIVIN